MKTRKLNVMMILALMFISMSIYSCTELALHTPEKKSKFPDTTPLSVLSMTPDEKNDSIVNVTIKSEKDAFLKLKYNNAVRDLGQITSEDGTFNFALKHGVQDSSFILLSEVKGKSVSYPSLINIVKFSIPHEFKPLLEETRGLVVTDKGLQAVPAPGLYHEGNINFSPNQYLGVYIPVEGKNIAMVTVVNLPTSFSYDWNAEGSYLLIRKGAIYVGGERSNIMFSVVFTDGTIKYYGPYNFNSL